MRIILLAIALQCAVPLAAHGAEDKPTAPEADSVTKAVMTRPLCAYPSVAKYKGSGDSSDAANFECAKP